MVKHSHQAFASISSPTPPIHAKSQPISAIHEPQSQFAHSVHPLPPQSSSCRTQQNVPFNWSHNSPSLVLAYPCSTHNNSHRRTILRHLYLILHACFFSRRCMSRFQSNNWGSTWRNVIQFTPQTLWIIRTIKILFSGQQHGFPQRRDWAWYLSISCKCSTGDWTLPDRCDSGCTSDTVTDGNHPPSFRTTRVGECAHS